jgi:hypothetical protein
MLCLYLWTTTALLTVHLPGIEGDLSKIDRTVGEEPAYQSKPKYCLVVFGPEAKTRMWLVLDGDVLYADCKANGDLTGQDQRFLPKGGTSFFVDKIPANHAGHPFTLRLDVKTTGYQIQCFTQDSPGFRTAGVLLFADRPEDAPVVHFQGPLTFTILDWNHPGKSAQLVRGGKDNELSILVGTPVFGGKNVAFATFLQPKRGVDGFPVVEVEFPGDKPGAKPIFVRAAVRL